MNAGYLAGGIGPAHSKANLTIFKCLRFPLAVGIVVLHTSEIYCHSSNIPLSVVATLLFNMTAVIVPVFFFMSGNLFFNGLDKWNWKIYREKMIRRLRTLLLPYILWNIICFFVRFGYHAFLNHIPCNTETLLSSFMTQGGIRIFFDSFFCNFRTNLFGLCIPFTGPIDNPLWFVRDLFMMSLISPMLWLVIKQGGVGIVLALFVLWLLDVGVPFGGFSSSALFFFSLGGFCSIKHTEMRSLWGRGTLCLILLWLITVLFTSSMEEKPVISHIFLNCSVCASFPLVFIIASFCSNRPDWNKLLCSFQGTAFFIYASHTIGFLTLAVSCVDKLFSECNCYVSIFKLLLAPTLVILACLFTYQILKYLLPSVLSVLVGRR